MNTDIEKVNLQRQITVLKKDKALLSDQASRSQALILELEQTAEELREEKESLEFSLKLRTSSLYAAESLITTLRSEINSLRKERDLLLPMLKVSLVALLLSASGLAYLLL